MMKMFLVPCSFAAIALSACNGIPAADIPALDAAAGALTAPACKALAKTKPARTACRTDAGILITLGDALASQPAAAAQ